MAMQRSLTVSRLRLSALLVSALFVLDACSVPFPVYSVSGKNVQAIRAIPATVKLGDFAGTQSSVTCRLAPIAPENGTTFAAYIRNAFNDELIIAGAPEHVTQLEIRGTVKTVDVSCGIITGTWTIAMDISINGQPPFTVKTERDFDGNYLGAVVLQRAYTAFVPSVQQFVNDVLNSPQFKAAVAQPQTM